MRPTNATAPAFLRTIHSGAKPAARDEQSPELLTEATEVSAHAAGGVVNPHDPSARIDVWTRVLMLRDAGRSYWQIGAAVGLSHTESRTWCALP
jgi:hypothetical protein